MGMTFNDFQKSAVRTADSTLSIKEQTIECALGLAGESGEVIDIIKKFVYHGHPMDRDELIKEAGDCAWYLAVLFNVLGIDFDEVAEANKRKLEERYPDGFDKERSLHRRENNG